MVFDTLSQMYFFLIIFFIGVFNFADVFQAIDFKLSLRDETLEPRGSRLGDYEDLPIYERFV